MIDEESKERAENLKNLNKGDFIWVVEKHPMFQTHSDNYASNPSKYLGYDSGSEDSNYDDSIYVFKATSPTIYAPTKMVFVAKVINGECKNDIAYVFSDDMHEFEWGDFRFGQHIIRPHDHFRGYKSQDFYLDVLQFERGIEINMKDVFFNKQDCIKECRKRNNSYSSSREITLIGKTISSLKKQFDAFKKSEVMVDAKKQIEKDLNYKTKL